MKKCTYCGKQYGDAVSVCEVDAEPVLPVGQIASSDSTIDSTEDREQVERPHGKASRDMVVGGLWCGGGILVTAATYSSAAGGGSYVVAWGAILFGGLQFLRGLLAK